jgi:hypothetical protein
MEDPYLDPSGCERLKGIEEAFIAPTSACLGADFRFDVDIL